MSWVGAKLNENSILRGKLKGAPKNSIFILKYIQKFENIGTFLEYFGKFLKKLKTQAKSWKHSSQNSKTTQKPVTPVKLSWQKTRPFLASGAIILLKDCHIMSIACVMIIAHFRKFLKDLQSKCMSWNSFLATHLSNQNYEICIRRTSGSCRICYWPQTTGTSGSETDQVWVPIMQKILSVVPKIPVR